MEIPSVQPPVAPASVPPPADWAGATVNRVSGSLRSLPAAGMETAVNLAGFALPILGTIYLVRTGIMTVLGNPPPIVRKFGLA